MVYGEIASGGMASVQYGRLMGSAGFSRAVAIKRLHPQFAKDENFVSMLLDEARLSARISHANVVQTMDVLSEPGELSIIMEYVHGESLARLLQRVETRGERVPVRIAVTLVAGVLHGLHAAHETLGERGEPLHIVHRDVSPENILVGSDGLARLIDFGVARAQGRSRVTPAGELKGKLAYMSCEQYRGGEIDRRVDVYGASVVLWEALTGRELFAGETEVAVVGAVMSDEVPPPSKHASEVIPALDAIVLRGISREREVRFETAREMALALERAVGLATQSEVSDWLERVAGEGLAERAEALRRMRMLADSTSGSGADAPVTRRMSTPASAAGAAGDAPSAEPPRVTPSALPSPGLGLRTKSHARRTLAWVAGVLALVLVVALLWPRLEAHEQSQTEQAESVSSTSRGAAVGAAREPAASERESKTPGAPSASFEAAPDASPLPSGVRAQKSAEVPARGNEPAVNDGADRKTTDGKSSADRKVGAEGKSAADEKPAPRRRAKVDCTSPFVVDARGIRRVKPECLE